MKITYLKCIIYLVGFIALYAFFAVRSFPLMNAVLVEKMDKETQGFYKYGELYYFSCISDFKVGFKEYYPKYRLSDKNPKITEADVLTFGDSFIDLPFQKNIPELLSDTLDKKVFTYAIRDPTHSNPFCLLNSQGFQYSRQNKIFIYESVERNIPEKFEDPFNIACSNSKQKITLKRKIKDFIFRKNSENLYTVMLKQSYLTSHLYSAIATIKFKLFGYISPLTSVYSTKPEPWLFHEKEYTRDLGGFYYPYTNAEIETYADNILDLKNNLKVKYNLDLLFLPIPTKYTIYHKFVNNDSYNGFLPKLYKELDKRGVKYVSLYNEFANSPRVLYHGTDTHWNSEGVQIALEKIIHVIPEISTSQYVQIPSDKYSFISE